MKLENNEICRIVDGDEIAFNRFMEHYSSRLYHYKKELKVINYRKMAIIKTLPFSYKSLLLK